MLATEIATKKTKIVAGKLSDQIIEEIERLGGVGLTMDQLRLFYSIPLTTWEKRARASPQIQEALQRGKQKMIAQVAGKLMELVNKGNISAIIFYLKTQARWRDTPLPGEDFIAVSKMLPSIVLTVNDPLEAAKIYQKIMTDT